MVQKTAFWKRDVILRLSVRGLVAAFGGVALRGLSPKGLQQLVLAVTTALVFGLGATAHAGIDDFDTAQGPVVDSTVGGAITNGPLAIPNPADTDLVGATRTLSVDVTNKNFTTGSMSLEVGGGVLSVSSGSGVSGIAQVEWTGFAPTDLTQGGLAIGILLNILDSAVEIPDSAAVSASTVTLTLTKSGGGILSELLNMPEVDFPTSVGHIFMFGGDFTQATDITTINLTFAGDANFKATVDF